ncbi:MAG: hypothetical protein F2780_00780 [Actinobacteria bacterium]|uniref:Unannotated protein n=1 Tax=freshwater metagenome TaxID=449393 RepID=A0A6J7CHH4_9ZZZZ|nr:hypothetical protein [Actinomycetota bacterium]
MSERRKHLNLNPRKWFDRMQPQTMQIATWLLYLNGFFALISFMDKRDWIGYARVDKGAFGSLIGILVVGSFIGGGFLMANDRKIGYKLAVVAAFSPFALRIWVLWSYSGYSNLDKITGNDTIGFIFEAALCALLLHPHSREHQRVWYT